MGTPSPDYLQNLTTGWPKNPTTTLAEGCEWMTVEASPDQRVRREGDYRGMTVDSHQIGELDARTAASPSTL